ncbi:MAG: AAA family ATPase [Treponema sp.]|nr:AAA family ATPase [Treponema sp.]
MILSELIQRSPIRIFEQSIHGGLKAGEIGVISSPNGVGKTSVLVQLAMDKLLQGKKVIHVSFTQHNQYVPLWYDDIFSEFTSKKNLENAAEIKNDLVKNRVLMNFNQDGVTKDQILKSLRAMIIEGGFKADSIIIDGFDFARHADSASAAANTSVTSVLTKEKETDLFANFKAVKNFATEMGLSIWYSCSVNDDAQYDKENIPAALNSFINNIDIVIVLQPKTDHVELSISKDRDSVISKSMAMNLDPKTLLILEA